MNYHLILTRQCNLNCHYCYGEEVTGPHTEIEYSLDDLAKFLRQDPDVQLMFYGGEPTLRIPLMTDIITRFPSARYMLQTNGLLLHVQSRQIGPFQLWETCGQQIHQNSVTVCCLTSRAHPVKNLDYVEDVVCLRTSSGCGARRDFSKCVKR